MFLSKLKNTSLSSEITVNSVNQWLPRRLVFTCLSLQAPFHSTCPQGFLSRTSFIFSRLSVVLIIGRGKKHN